MGHYEGLPELEIENIISYLEEHEKKCYNCGELVENARFQSYTHDGGMKLKGFLTTQWVYFVCRKCELELALWKLLSPKDWAYLIEEANKDAEKRHNPYKKDKGDSKGFLVGGEELPKL